LKQFGKRFFSGTRGQSCAGAALRSRILASAKAAAEVTLGLGSKSKAGKFAWVKNWGYGPTAYVLDFMDPAILPAMLKEFHSIYDDMMKLPPDDTADYADPFDLKKLLATSTDKALNAKAMKDLTLLNKNYDPSIYNVSVNAVQIHKAMIDWKWSADFGLSDFAKSFIKRYDMNGDGRLNPREIILGAIDHNKHLFGMPGCTHCFQEVSKKLDAIFMFIDCDNDGIIKAEDLWNNLPKLKRNSPQFNMFALSKDAGIRTAAVNDFVLKNMSGRSGILTKVAFRNAIILGMWDRQTDFTKVLDDDSRTLKELRWKDDDMVDIKAEEYIKDGFIAEMKKKANQI